MSRWDVVSWSRRGSEYFGLRQLSERTRSTNSFPSGYYRHMCYTVYQQSFGAKLIVTPHKITDSLPVLSELTSVANNTRQASANLKQYQ